MRDEQVGLRPDGLRHDRRGRVDGEHHSSDRSHRITGHQTDPVPLLGSGRLCAIL